MSVGVKTQLGIPYPGADGKWYVRALAHGTLVEGNPYLITCSYDSAGHQSAVTADPDAVASVYRLFGWATQVAASGEEVILQVAGEFEAYIDGGTSDIAAGDFLKLIPGTSTQVLVYEGTTITNSSLAVAVDAYTSGTAARYTVNLLPQNIFGRIVNT